MLVVDGHIHPKISADGPSQKIRNGVGVRDDGRVAVFAISERPVTFGAFARLFKDTLGCRNALFLDGSVSSLYAPSMNRYGPQPAAGPDGRGGGALKARALRRRPRGRRPRPPPPAGHRPRRS